MRRTIGIAIGNQISPVIEGLDVDSIVHQIDLEDILVNKVDLNRVLETVDIDLALSRVDLDVLMTRVDVNSIIERSNLEAIIARSSLGVCTKCFDVIRSNMAYLDQWGQRFGRFSCFSKQPWLPPIPGRSRLSKSSMTPWPENCRGGIKFGRAVQYRCCGTATRWLSGFIDWLLATAICALLTWITRLIADAIVGDGYEWNNNFLAFLPLIYLFIHTTLQVLCIACLGKTVGMAFVGLLLVSRDGHRVGICQATFRTLLTPLNLIFFGWIIGLCRRDGCEYNDILTRTRLIYCWSGPLGFKRHRRDEDYEMSVASTLLDSDDESLGSGGESRNGDLVQPLFSAAEIPLADPESSSAVASQSPSGEKKTE